MIGRILLGLTLVCAAGAAWAQAPACTLDKVNTSMLNISKEAGGELYTDALFDGDIVCVTRSLNVNGKDWAYISHRVAPGSVQTPVEGWAAQQYLLPMSVDEARAALSGEAPPAASTAPPPAAPPAPNPVAKSLPPSATETAPVSQGAAAAVRPEDVLGFNQPIPFGPYPVNGHSIKEMIDTIPQFPPIEGLDKSLWEKKCTSCHQWNQDRLCEQGLSYVRSPKAVLRVPHPFGGALKLALMRWAKSGCSE